MKKLLRDRRGFMMERQIFIVFVVMFVLQSIGHRSIWKGLLYSAGTISGLLLFILLLTLVMMGWERVSEHERVKPLLESKGFRIFWRSFKALCGAVVLGAICAFAGIFISGLADTPKAQLRIMQALTAGGALIGFACAWYANRPED